MANWGTRLAKLAQFLATGGTVPETAISTAETDTDLRLAPDGAGGVEWGTGGGGGGLTVPDLLNSVKGSADTPDDDFPGTSLDAKWTAVDGSAGSVSLLASSGAGVYEVGERDSWILFQLGTASGDSVILRQDYTLPDGSCIVAPLSIGEDIVAALTNNEIWLGIGVNDNDTGPFSGTAGQTAGLIFDTDANAPRILGWDGSAVIGQNVAAPVTLVLPDIVYFRISRVALVYHLFYSLNGFSWTYVGSKTMTTAANNVWLIAQCLATMANRMVVGCPWFRQGTGLTVDPWPL